MSQTGGLAPRLDPDAAPLGDAQVRPKVMRRPTHFSSAPVSNTPAAVAPLPLSEAPLPVASAVLAVPVSAPAKPWQEDARFGVAMVLIVVLVNLGLAAWLPHLHKPIPVALPDIAPAIGEAAPDKPTEGITLYTKPSANPAEDESPSGLQKLPASPVHVLGEPPASE